MYEKSFLTVVLGALLSTQAHPADDGTTLKFSDYPITIYSGSLHIPSYYVKSGDVWRDDMGKEVVPPSVNFAGKYYIGLHSCGAECRYYTLSDLAAGNESKALDMFSSDGEKPQRTNDGRTYETELISRKDSRMVIVQYHIDQSLNKSRECRERLFLLSEDGKSVSPLTGTINSCQLIEP